eukprot:520556-Pelagomonas_calceolata.AAC.1
MVAPLKNHQRNGNGYKKEVTDMHYDIHSRHPQLIERRRLFSLQTNRAGTHLLDSASNHKLITTL